MIYPIRMVKNSVVKLRLVSVYILSKNIFTVVKASVVDIILGDRELDTALMSYSCSKKNM